MNSVPLLPGAARRNTRRVRIGELVIGGPAVPVIAGPCAVEWNYVEHAASMARTPFSRGRSDSSSLTAPGGAGTCAGPLE